MVRQTHIRTNYPQMLSGPVEGQFLKMLVEISGAKRILEIGTFTGYSTICLAAGIPDGGHIDALELNDELEDIIVQGWERAGILDTVTLHTGDARETIASLPGPFDFVFMDANKREYCEYYDLVMPKLVSGGLILADDVMLGGKVFADNPSTDAQTSGLVAFNEKVKADPRVEQVMLPLRDGLTLIRRL